jgi:hypothetical protein
MPWHLYTRCSWEGAFFAQSAVDSQALCLTAALSNSPRSPLRRNVPLQGQEKHADTHNGGHGVCCGASGGDQHRHRGCCGQLDVIVRTFRLPGTHRSLRYLMMTWRSEWRICMTYSSSTAWHRAIELHRTFPRDLWWENVHGTGGLLMGL